MATAWLAWLARQAAQVDNGAAAPLGGDQRMGRTDSADPQQTDRSQDDEFDWLGVQQETLPLTIGRCANFTPENFEPRLVNASPNSLSSQMGQTTRTRAHSWFGWQRAELA